MDRRLDEIGVAPARRIDIIEEVAAYLHDRYEELLADGCTEAQARARALADLEADRFARELVE